MTTLSGLVDEASSLEYEMRGDPEVDTQLPRYARQIEAWRTKVGVVLTRELPRSGALQRFQVFDPVVGQGPVSYEYGRLLAMREHLVQILSEIEKYQRQTQLSR